MGLVGFHKEGNPSLVFSLHPLSPPMDSPVSELPSRGQSFSKPPYRSPRPNLPGGAVIGKVIPSYSLTPRLYLRVVSGESGNTIQLKPLHNIFPCSLLALSKLNSLYYSAPSPGSDFAAPTSGASDSIALPQAMSMGLGIFLQSLQLEMNKLSLNASLSLSEHLTPPNLKP